uniref:Ionotropic glutamate receptor C-terminal domain-containing protein n=1 Tax=Nelumbo nucifera TaxID=4432 RepID=A0A822XQW8_NELNU|nr:TPA_asm: hypothetical protein HUJ06_024190 [Nelumbo nucifera]
MVVPVRKISHRAWMFLKPFTMTMWLATVGILIYTMFVVWFLEHRTNRDFRGPWKSQLGTALWFTFSTLFFAHRERLNSNFTRVVMVVWLFVVLVLNSSYTANLASVLTVQRLEPTATDIETLKRDNAIVGCDGDSFIRKYLVDVLGFKPKNIKNVTSEYSFPGEFDSGNIGAAFLELPYEKSFLSQHCKNYTATEQTYSFGGLGFVFPKDSPLAAHVSKAILVLSEDGTIKRLENKWFPQNSQCLNSKIDIGNESLSLQSFWGLFVLTGGTSTIIFMLYLSHLFRKYRHHRDANQVYMSPTDESLWSRTVRLAQYFHKAELHHPARASTVEDWRASSWEYINESDYNTAGHPQATPLSEIEMPETSNL